MTRPGWTRQEWGDSEAVRDRDAEIAAAITVLTGLDVVSLDVEDDDGVTAVAYARFEVPEMDGPFLILGGRAEEVA